MRRAKTIAAVIGIVFLVIGTAGAAQRSHILRAVPYDGRPVVRDTIDVTYFEDDMESGEGDWTHGDFTAGAIPHFHRSTFLPYEGTYSWWCGTLDYDEPGEDEGGYGNDWVDYLVVPDLDLDGLGSAYPIMTFAYRFDLEPDYDYAWIEAESLGVYTNLNRGYTGSSSGWQDYGIFGFLLGDYDQAPFSARFHVRSDGGYSDEDGNYDSDGGAFHCDNVKVFEYGVGTTYFLDDAEDDLPDVCVPGVQTPAGDFWHIQDRACKAASGTHAWWCGDDADTSVVPPNLRNWLMTPYVEVGGAVSCTLSFLYTWACPTTDGGWKEQVTLDGGSNWYLTGWWFGDQGSLGYGPCVIFITTTPCIPDLAASGSMAAFRLIMETGTTPYGPGVNGDAGITLDDTWFFGKYDTPVQRSTWGQIKSFFR